MRVRLIEHHSRDTPTAILWLPPARHCGILLGGGDFVSDHDLAHDVRSLVDGRNTISARYSPVNFKDPAFLRGL